jgi:excisionase family DNA binding protein
MSPRIYTDNFDGPIADSRRSAAVDRNNRAFPIAAFCNRYGIGRSKAYEEIKSGRLVALKVGRRTLISTDDAERWLSSLHRAGPSLTLAQ